MPKLNEGDVIEGIFTIALALYIAYGEINKSKLNKIRTEIDTKLFNTGRFKYTVIKKQKRQKGKNIPDFFDVTFEMRLKPQSVVGAFGEEYEVLYKSSNDVGKIDNKIDALIKYVNNTNFSRKIDTAINSFLDNNVGEIVTFNVVADGIAGEASGGQIKGDITLDIHAKSKSESKKIVSESISFSLKSESVTVANLSPYRGMLDIAKAMDISWNGEKKYSRLSKPFKGPVEQQAKFKLIEEMYTELKKKIKSVSTSPTFTDKALGFLHESIFGKDLADVIDIQSGAVKEIDVEYFNALRKSIKLEVEEKGNNLVFVDKTSKAPIFQIRTKLRESANEAKFYLEVGKGIYRK